MSYKWIIALLSTYNLGGFLLRVNLFGVLYC